MKPYPQQIAAMAAALRAHRGTIVMPTGSGKSVTMALIVQELQLRTLIIVPTVHLREQLRGSFQKWFGKTSNITILNIDSRQLKTEKDYDVLIIDEAHHVAASTYRKLNKTAWAGIYYRFFFTATPYRGREEEQILMESIAGKVVYRLHYDEAVSAGMICGMEAYYLEVPKSEIDSNNWHTVYKALVVDNLPRNLQIAAILGNLKDAGRSTLCLVKEVAHGEALSKLTGIPFAHGQAEDSERLISQYSNGRINSLIATEGVCGEGVDTKAAEYVIVAGLGKSRPAFMQKCGRGFRQYPGKDSAKVILLRDASHKFTLSHFREQVKVVREEYGVEPMRLE